MTPAELTDRWTELGAGRRGSSGMDRRRLDAEAAVDIFACVFWPQGRSGLLIQGAGRVDALAERMPKCRGVRVEHEEREGRPSEPLTQVTIRLEEDRLRDIFAVLAADLVNTVVAEPAAPAALRRCVDRLCMWQGLFERLSPEGLSDEHQRGLYGELVVMDAQVLEENRLLRGVSAWTGPDADHHDFRMGGVALEVKTTLAKRHARIPIANERQLDERAHDALLLASVRLDESEAHGRSLPAVVANLRERLGGEEAAARLFDEKLVLADYLDVHAPLYDARRFRVTSTDWFRVEGDFPRLTGAGLPAGVGDIRYSIIADDLDRWRIAEDEVTTLLGGAG